MKIIPAPDIILYDTQVEELVKIIKDTLEGDIEHVTLDLEESRTFPGSLLNGMVGLIMRDIDEEDLKRLHIHASKARMDDIKKFKIFQKEWQRKQKEEGE